MIEINKLKFAYRKQAPLFEDLSLELGSGNIVGLLGKNGAGKSTLLKLISGGIFSANNAIQVLGKDPMERNPNLLKHIFYVPEEIFLPNVRMKHYAKAISVLYPDFDTAKLASIMQEFEINGEMKIQKVSYGQKKKFLIAVALSSNCKLLIMDEPTNGLDIPSKALFRKVVASSTNEDQTVVISTHQVKDIENLIDQVMVIEHGKMVLNKPLFEISDNYTFKSVFKVDEAEVLYSEEVPGGYKVLVKEEASGSDVDLEILFNAVTNGITLN